MYVLGKILLFNYLFIGWFGCVFIGLFIILLYNYRFSLNIFCMNVCLYRLFDIIRWVLIK